MSIYTRSLLGGVAAGLIAGVVMGFMIIQMMGGTEGGTINKIAALYGFSSAGAGFIAHLVHSVFIGALFGLVWRMYAITFKSGLLWGIAYGFIWWILGPVIIMPLWLAGAIRLAGEAGGVSAALPSLPGHLVFGLLLGFFYALMMRKYTERSADALLQRERNAQQGADSDQSDGSALNT